MFLEQPVRDVHVRSARRATAPIQMRLKRPRIQTKARRGILEPGEDRRIARLSVSQGLLKRRRSSGADEAPGAKSSIVALPEQILD
jgi:hypothetical protein